MAVFRVEVAIGISERWRTVARCSTAVPPRVRAVPLASSSPEPFAIVVRTPRSAIRVPFGVRGGCLDGRIRVLDVRGRVVRWEPFAVEVPRPPPCAVPGSGTWRE